MLIEKLFFNEQQPIKLVCFTDKFLRTNGCQWTSM